MTASDGARSWSATRADFLTWELHRLVRWLQAIAVNEPDTDTQSATFDAAIDPALFRFDPPPGSVQVDKLN